MFPETRRTETAVDRMHDTPAHKFLAEFSARAPMMIRASVGGVEGITRDREFKTQHETGTSNGSYDPNYRREFEESTFGPGARPVYGYLSHGEIRDQVHDRDTHAYDQVSSYGDTAFQLKEHVRKNITYTPHDSLGTPKEAVATPGSAPNTSLGFRIPDRDPAEVALQSYTEMQVHQPLSTGDVQRAFHYRDHTRAWGASRGAETEERVTTGLREAGIPHEVVDVHIGGQRVLDFEDHNDWNDAAYIHGHWPDGTFSRSGAERKIPRDEYRPIATARTAWSPSRGQFDPNKWRH